MVFDPHMRNQHTILLFNSLAKPAKKEASVKRLHWIPELPTRFLVQFEDNTFYEYDVLKDDKAVNEEEATTIIHEMRAIERVNFQTAFKDIISSPDNCRRFMSGLGS